MYSMPTILAAHVSDAPKHRDQHNCSKRRSFGVPLGLASINDSSPLTTRQTALQHAAHAHLLVNNSRSYSHTTKATRPARGPGSHGRRRRQVCAAAGRHREEVAGGRPRRPRRPRPPRRSQRGAGAHLARDCRRPRLAGRARPRRLLAPRGRPAHRACCLALACLPGRRRRPPIRARTRDWIQSKDASASNPI